MLDRDKCISDGSSVLVLPLEPVTKYMYEATDVLKHFDEKRNPNGYISTNCDGRVYNQGHLSEFLSANNNCSISFSCDGVLVFKFRNYSI